LRAGRLQAVVLDVWEGEPCIDTELLEMVDLGTPHIAGYSYDGKVAGTIMIYRAFCRHFGLPANFDASDLLPPAEVPRLEMRTAGVTDEELLARAVEQIYRIQRDDRALRRIVDQPRENQGRFFDSLRKNYPIRREFHNTTVVLDPRRESLARKLNGIGFNVEGDR
jgi:erythronate-4-phosphate dehydrogenase